MRWLERLLALELSPVDVPADLLEARADYTEVLVEKVAALESAIELSHNRGDLHMQLGSTYVNLQLWLEALEQLRTADYLRPPEEHEPVVKLLETAEKAYAARFLSRDETEQPATP